MGLTITASDADGTPIFAVRGEIDIYTVPEFLQAVETSAREAAAIVVDLREVALVDSSGLGALLRLAHVDGRWRPVVLVCADQTVPQLLELTKLADRFFVIDDPTRVGQALVDAHDRVARSLAER